MSEFLAYLEKKKINATLFLKNEPEMFAEWEKAYSVYHTESFTMQKKFLINKIRRKFSLPNT